MQVRRPATNVTHLVFHFRSCIQRMSNIKVVVAVHCHAVLNFGWRAAILSVSFCSPTPPSVPTGSFQPSPNEWKFHFVKHGANRPMSIQRSGGGCWHHTAGREQAHVHTAVWRCLLTPHCGPRTGPCPYSGLAVAADTTLRAGRKPMSIQRSGGVCWHHTAGREEAHVHTAVWRCLLTPYCWPLFSYPDRNNLSSIVWLQPSLFNDDKHIRKFPVMHSPTDEHWVQVFPFWILSVGRYTVVTLLLVDIR